MTNQANTISRKLMSWAGALALATPIFLTILERGAAILA
jgi:hypothetical protein